MRAELNTPNRQVLDVDGAAALMGTTPKGVRQRIARRLLPFHKLGSRVIFMQGELEQFLAALPGCSAEEAECNVAARNGTNGVAR
jgi:hypothetical protein